MLRSPHGRYIDPRKTTGALCTESKGVREMKTLSRLAAIVVALAIPTGVFAQTTSTETKTSETKTTETKKDTGKKSTHKKSSSSKKTSKSSTTKKPTPAAEEKK
jgi:hypothetical protein